MELLSKVLQAILEAALPLLAVALVGWVSAKAAEIIKRIKVESPEAAFIIAQMARTVVKAAEQVFGSGEGAAKKEYALAVFEAYLKSKGIKLDLKVIDAMIEAAVKEMKDHGEEAEQPEEVPA